MTALQVLKELKKEKWPELKTGEYNLPLILAAMHKFAELRQCNVSGALPPRSEVEQWFTGQDTVPAEYWQEAPYRTNGDVYEQVYDALEYYMRGGNAS